MRKIRQETEEIISAGIDIGTSTTKLVISRFLLANTAGTAHVPKIEIMDKTIIYKSPIYRTPLLSAVLIDMDGVSEIVKLEYQKAGIHPNDVQTGAVIITGETATKENAEEMVHLLSSQAGEFLVATAGPDLEGIIAAKGSGAYQYSKETGKIIANVDIGGGTANIAVFQAGHLLGTCTLHIGGRLIEFEGERIKSISSPLKKVLKQLGLPLSVGDRIQLDILKELLQAMVAILARTLQGKLEERDHALLLGHPPSWGNIIEEVMFSGGVSECLYQIEEKGEEKEGTQYQDIGLHLAQVLRENVELKRWKWITPKKTIRATVLGAGTQTTEISGATIQVEPSRLPLKNLPVYHIPMDEGFKQGNVLVKQAIKEAMQIYDPVREGRNFAIYLSGLPVLTFQQVQLLASWLLDAFHFQDNQDDPIVIVVSNDMAKVLGQTLQTMDSSRDIICIDQILVEQGDYIDIGNMLKTEVVPVIVKTLAFHS